MAGLICNDKCSRYFAYHILEEELNIRLSISLNNLQKDVDCCETSQGTHSNDSLGFGKSFSEIKLCKVTVCDKEELLLHPPYILHQLSQHLLQHLDTEGLFRKRGLTRRINILKDKLEQGVELSDENPHDVANLFTLFLRQLPQHLFPASFNPILLQVLHSMQEANQIKMVQCLCWLLPRSHFETLLYVVHFFQSVAQHSNNNRMSLDGLATILAPNIVQFEMTAKNYRIITETQTHFVHLLLLHALNFVQLPTMSTEVLCEVDHPCVHIADVSNSMLESTNTTKRRRSFAGRMINSVREKLLHSHHDHSIKSNESVKMRRKRAANDVDDDVPTKRRSLQGAGMVTPPTKQSKPYHFTTNDEKVSIDFVGQEPCAVFNKQERHDSGSTSCCRIPKMKPRSRRSLRGSARKKPDIVVTHPGEKTGRRLAHHDHLKSTTQLTVVKAKPNSLLQRLKFASPSVGRRRIARKETKKMHHLSVDTLATTVSEDSDQGGGCSVDVASKKKPLNVFDLSIETLISMNKPSGEVCHGYVDSTECVHDALIAEEARHPESLFSTSEEPVTMCAPPSQDDLHTSTQPSQGDQDKCVQPQQDDLNKCTTPNQDNLDKCTQPCEDDLDKSTQPSADDLDKCSLSLQDVLNECPKLSLDYLDKCTQPSEDDLNKCTQPYEDNLDKCTTPSPDYLDKCAHSQQDALDKCTQPNQDDLVRCTTPNQEYLDKCTQPCENNLDKCTQPSHYDLDVCADLLNELIDKVVSKTRLKAPPSASPLTRSRVISRYSGLAYKRGLRDSTSLIPVYAARWKSAIRKPHDGEPGPVPPSRIPTLHAQEAYHNDENQPLVITNQMTQSTTAYNNTSTRMIANRSTQPEMRCRIPQNRLKTSERGKVRAAIQHFDRLANGKLKLPPLPYKKRTACMELDSNTIHKRPASKRELRSATEAPAEAINKLSGNRTKPHKAHANVIENLNSRDYLDFSPVKRAAPVQPRSRAPMCLDVHPV